VGVTRLEESKTAIPAQPDGDRIEIERASQFGQDFPNVFAFGTGSLIQDLQQTERQIVAFVDGFLFAGKVEGWRAIAGHYL
jgi:hypothetical protein